jgi:hypothetical protein
MDNPAPLSLKINQSKAYQIRMRLQTFSNNYSVFEGNYRELNRLLSAAQHPEAFQILWIQSKRPQMNVITRELGRLLHNFVTSAKTLVDHTRTFVDEWYGETHFFNEYHSEVQKRFIGNPIVGFTEDLRNYALHFQLPFAVAVVRFTIGQTSNENVRNQSFVLPKNKLLEWSNWSSKGKSYLEMASEEIPIQKTVDVYFQEVNAFHAWMQHRLKEIHANELRWLDKMAQRIRGA